MLIMGNRTVSGIGMKNMWKETGKEQEKRWHGRKIGTGEKEICQPRKSNRKLGRVIFDKLNRTN